MGELAALGAAMSWSLASLLFERFGRTAGGLALNTLKNLIALSLFVLSLWLVAGRPWPDAMGVRSLGLLGVSGLVGLSIGDTLWFGSLLRIGARRAVLVATVAPPMTAVLGALVLSEPLTAATSVGMVLTLAGIVWVILERTEPVAGSGVHGVDWFGVLLGVLSAACQAVGSVLTKLGAEDHTALEVSLVRLAVGSLGLAVVVTLSRRWHRVRAPLQTPRSALAVISAAVLGAYVGIWLMNAGFLLAPVGIAATLNATSPLFVLPLAVLLFGERVSLRSVVGALVAVSGVALLFVAA